MTRRLASVTAERLCGLLASRHGLAIDHARLDGLERAVVDQMARRELATPEDYVRVLDEPGELVRLAEALSIGETYFLRNPPHFELLREWVVLPAARDARRLALWSAGCSTGEEVYSMAIALLESVPNPARRSISILATDTHRERLAHAARGVYGPRAVRQVPRRWLAKYFTPEGDRFRVRDEVRSLVRFERHDLVAEPCASAAMAGVDAIFCRNVFIYLTPDVIRRVLDRFAGCLRRDGYLFLGEAETLWNLSSRFACRESREAMVYQVLDGAGEHVCPTTDAGEGDPAGNRVLEGEAASRVPPPEATPVASDFERGLAAVHGKRDLDALGCFDDAIAADPTDTRAALAKAALLADRGDCAEALRLLTAIVDDDRLAIEAHYRLGVVYQRMDCNDEAIASFERALFIDPCCGMAHVGLARSYQAAGRPSDALRANRNALAALVGGADDDAVSFGDDLTRGYLRAVCRRMIAKLESRAEVR